MPGVIVTPVISPPPASVLSPAASIVKVFPDSAVTLNVFVAVVLTLFDPAPFPPVPDISA